MQVPELYMNVCIAPKGKARLRSNSLAAAGFDSCEESTVRLDMGSPRHEFVDGAEFKGAEVADGGVLA